MERWSVYAYHTWRPIDQLSLHGGISYDHVKYPENVRSIPMSDSENTVERVLPKIGFVWNPDKRTAIRGAYTRSLGGASLEQSVRIEPTEVAGFNQAFAVLCLKRWQAEMQGRGSRRITFRWNASSERTLTPQWEESFYIRQFQGRAGQ